jgi:hypothetical protein
MKGGLTYKVLDRLKRKAAVLDQVREYLPERTVQGGDVGLQALLETVDAGYTEKGKKEGIA